MIDTENYRKATERIVGELSKIGFEHLKNGEKTEYKIVGKLIKYVRSEFKNEIKNMGFKGFECLLCLNQEPTAVLMGKHIRERHKVVPMLRSNFIDLDDQERSE